MSKVIGHCTSCGVQQFDNPNADPALDNIAHLCWKCCQPWRADQSTQTEDRTIDMRWTDGQLNVFHDTDCDQATVIRGEDVAVKLDSVGGTWWIACEHHPRFSQASFASRDDAKAAALQMHFA